ncbi:hypothetical protein AVEN_101730-1 [Araneus ventricosus]|uniref:Uncharacterized protein n=1 Tax=Araneus ventricosus TaxID=182803 RepID=A0A4Y2HRK8_ARAVE|nr:hypothetical protein AVEN_52491-1 [Araneus ventricosus]GBM68065.1 hypothetical protein AVEN_101730-1 [Araneus ventricosus]
MQGTSGYTAFILGDCQVGKTSLARRIFKNCDLIFVSSVNGATEYQVSFEGSESKTKFLEIRNSAFLTENAILCDADRDCAFFCYAIDDPESFQHVAETWIPLFREHVCDRMTMVLIGNKRDLRHNAEVVRNLSERGLQPVSMNQLTELYRRHDTIRFFGEGGRHYFPMFDQRSMVVNGTILNCN